MSRLLTDLAPAVIGSVGILAAGVPLRHTLTAMGVGAPGTLLLVGLATAIVTSPSFALSSRRPGQDLVLLATNLLRRASKNATGLPNRCRR